jgi:hypothetical protein
MFATVSCRSHGCRLERHLLHAERPRFVGDAGTLSGGVITVTMKGTAGNDLGLTFHGTFTRSVKGYSGKFGGRAVGTGSWSGEQQTAVEHSVEKAHPWTKAQHFDEDSIESRGSDRWAAGDHVRSRAGVTCADGHCGCDWPDWDVVTPSVSSLAIPSAVQPATGPTTPGPQARE